jgi:predicted negative regulator of RcsB-dependent stress response
MVLAINMARIYAKNGNLVKAEVLANEAVELAPAAENKETANILVGDLLVQKGSKAAAREAYRKAVSR